LQRIVKFGSRDRVMTSVVERGRPLQAGRE
jgi:hypothetical protein